MYGKGPAAPMQQGPFIFEEGVLIMERKPHQVLPSNVQEQIDRELIAKVLSEHNLDDNVDLVYKIINECMKAQQNNIDQCIERVVKKYRAEKQKAFLNEEKIH